MHDKEVRRTRAGYVGAVAQLARVMSEFEHIGVPLEPDVRGWIAPWSPDQYRVMGLCADAWQAVVRQRRAYDLATREAGHPETWPHG